jgi:peptidoglycan/xylan/chitin deacetylase (PgdA/CDA1 family)
MSDVKRLILGALDRAPVRGVIERLTHDRATILMLHRFAVPDVGVEGIEPAGLRRTLDYLRRQGYALLGLPEVFDRLAGRGDPLRRAVAFTIDDGYFDQVDVAAPVFADFDCPVTTFVCTGFADRRLWMWWDKIEWIFERTDRRRLEVDLGQAPPLVYEWSDAASRRRAQSDFTEACKRVSDADKHTGIARLALSAEVTLPELAPDRYRPLDWDGLRKAEDLGMRFAPHTVTHPVLARTSDAQSAREIEGSKTRLAQEARSPQDVFCYPNGQRGDFGAREYATLRKLGFQGSVVGWSGYGEPGHFAADDDQRFQVNRFSYSNDLQDITQCVTGFERLKAMLRGEY